MKKRELFFKEKRGMAAVKTPPFLILQIHLRSGLSKLGALTALEQGLWFQTYGFPQ